MRLLGITGGAGMGKSTTARLLRERGVPVADTDQLAHELVEPGKPALAEIAAHFGADMLDAEGRLHRAKLAEIVFADAEARRVLEGILHPRIRERWMAQAAQWRREVKPLGSVVIPLLYETEAEQHFDAVLCVACTTPSQHQRLCERGWNEEQIRQRLAAQMPIERKMTLANFVVWTEGDLASHAAQLERILAKLGLNS